LRQGVSADISSCASGIQKARTDFFRNFFAVAMAKASAGEVFIVVGSRIGDAVPPGQPGAYQNPLSDNALSDNPLNIWRTFEFPTLLANTLVTAVTGVDVSNNFQRTTNWSQLMAIRSSRYPRSMIIIHLQG